MTALPGALLVVCRFALCTSAIILGSAAALSQTIGGKCHLSGEISGIPPGTRELIVEINSRDRSDTPARTFTSNSGSFEFSGLEAGVYAVEIKTWQGDLLRTEQVMVTQSSAPVRFRLPSATFGRPASGTVSMARLRRDPSGESVHQYREAARMFALGDRKRGTKHLLKSLDRDPEFAEARIALGAAKAEEGEWVAAIVEFRQARADAPQLARAAELVATAALQLQRYEEAESVARQTLSRYPNNLLARHLLGLSLVMQGWPGEEALKCFRAASAEIPEARQALARLTEFLAADKPVQRDVATKP